MKASVVVPMRDEAANVRPLCEAFANLTATYAHVGEVIFVDDHSKDSTLKEIKANAANLPIIRAVVQNEQSGKGAAIKSGFRESRYEILVMMDGDQSYTPLDIPQLLGPILAGSADLVVGMGRDHHSSTLRRILSASFQLIFACMFRLPVSCPSEGLKAVVKTKFNQLDIVANNFDFDIELLIKARQRSFRITQVQVNRRGRAAGKSKVRVLPTAARFCARMVRLWFTQRRQL
ncbi:MAG TPA: glycosyltransferase family 2 protein [Candidatus Bathyarchaeia archaeon]|nr:glycosyltransferase family 2 protein [Candidatus Bathyarchaeia archaeon]